MATPANLGAAASANSTDTRTSIAVTTAGTAGAAGDTVLVVTNISSATPSQITVTDSAGNSYVLDSAGTADAGIFHSVLTNPLPIGATVTASWATAGNYSIIVDLYPGAGLTLVGSVAQTTETSSTTYSATVAETAGDFMYGVAESAAETSVTVNAPYTKLGSALSSKRSIVSSYDLPTTTGNVTWGCTWSTAHSGAVLAATYSIPASGHTYNQSATAALGIAGSLRRALGATRAAVSHAVASLARLASLHRVVKGLAASAVHLGRLLSLHRTIMGLSASVAHLHRLASLRRHGTTTSAGHFGRTVRTARHATGSSTVAAHKRLARTRATTVAATANGRRLVEHLLGLAVTVGTRLIRAMQTRRLVAVGTSALVAGGKSFNHTVAAGLVVAAEGRRLVGALLGAAPSTAVRLGRRTSRTVAGHAGMLPATARGLTRRVSAALATLVHIAKGKAYVWVVATGMAVSASATRAGHYLRQYVSGLSTHTRLTRVTAWRTSAAMAMAGTGVRRMTRAAQAVMHTLGQLLRSGQQSRLVVAAVNATTVVGRQIHTARYAAAHPSATFTQLVGLGRRMAVDGSALVRLGRSQLRAVVADVAAGAGLRRDIGLPVRNVVYSAVTQHRLVDLARTARLTGTAMLGRAVTLTARLARLGQHVLVQTVRTSVSALAPYFGWWFGQPSRTWLFGRPKKPWR